LTAAICISSNFGSEAMRKSTQSHWIAEAEARCLRETALSQRARLEPPIGIVWARRRPSWAALLPKLIARLTLAQSSRVVWRRSSSRKRD